MAIEIKIPKSVGGIRIDKKIRRRANKALKIAAGPAVRNFARATLHVARETQANARYNDGSDRKETIEMCESSIHIDGRRVAETFRTAAIKGLKTFLEGLEEGLREAKEDAAAAKEAAAEAEAAPQPKAPPKPRRKAKAKASGSSSGAARGARARP
jgi:hypothetical protein